VREAHLHGLDRAVTEAFLPPARIRAARAPVGGGPAQVSLPLAGGQSRRLADEEGCETEGCETEDE
jgi:hypothetical protein